MKIKSGIYCIENTITKKVYIGSSVCILDRIYAHKKLLNKNAHYNKHLQSAYNKNAEHFVFNVIEYVSDNEKLLEREQYWIDFYKSYDRKIGYNFCRYAYSCLGIKRTDETKKRISDINKGKTLSIEHREKISNAHKGRVHTSEARINMSNAHKGKSPSQETRQKMSDALKGEKGTWHGKTLSVESRKKMSDSHKGKTLSIETKLKISLAGKGHIVSTETREKISNAQKGRIFSEETKLKMSLAGRIRKSK